MRNYFTYQSRVRVFRIPLQIQKVEPTAIRKERILVVIAVKLILKGIVHAPKFLDLKHQDPLYGTWLQVSYELSATFRWCCVNFDLAGRRPAFVSSPGRYHLKNGIDRYLEDDTVRSESLIRAFKRSVCRVLRALKHLIPYVATSTEGSRGHLWNSQCTTRSR